MRQWSVVLLTLVLLGSSKAQTQPNKIVLKVNLGGGPSGDFLGEDQVLDMQDFAKNIARMPIQNTDQQDIFQTQRFSRNDAFTLRIPVPDGIYSLTLLFAETYKPACVPGGRVFDISLGTPVSGVTKVIENFDVFLAAGCASAHGRRFEKVPSKEGIVVHFTKKAQHPSLCGFIVEGYPVPKGDGSEYRAIGRGESLSNDGAARTFMGGGDGRSIPTSPGGSVGLDAQQMASAQMGSYEPEQHSAFSQMAPGPKQPHTGPSALTAGLQPAGGLGMAQPALGGHYATEV